MRYMNTTPDEYGWFLRFKETKDGTLTIEMKNKNHHENERSVFLSVVDTFKLNAFIMGGEDTLASDEELVKEFEGVEK